MSDRSKMAPGAPGGAKPPMPGSGARAGGGGLSVPPQCPRCELTKSQFGRTLQNYQKAYRKKVEGLKTELGSTRGQVSQLQQKVQRLQGLTRVHLPSTVAGVLLGALAARFAGRASGAARSVLRRLRPQKKAPAAGNGNGNGHGAEHSKASAAVEPAAALVEAAPPAGAEEPAAEVLAEAAAASNGDGSHADTVTA